MLLPLWQTVSWLVPRDVKYHSFFRHLSVGGCRGGGGVGGSGSGPSRARRAAQAMAKLKDMEAAMNEFFEAAATADPTAAASGLEVLPGVAELLTALQVPLPWWANAPAPSSLPGTCTSLACGIRRRASGTRCGVCVMVCNFYHVYLVCTLALG